MDLIRSEETSDASGQFRRRLSPRRISPPFRKGSAKSRFRPVVLSSSASDVGSHGKEFSGRHRNTPPFCGQTRELLSIAENGEKRQSTLAMLCRTLHAPRLPTTVRDTRTAGVMLPSLPALFLIHFLEQEQRVLSLAVSIGISSVSNSIRLMCAWPTVGCDPKYD